MSERKKKSPLVKKKKDSSGDRKGILQSLKGASSKRPSRRESEASKTPAATSTPTPNTKPVAKPTPTSIAPTKSDIDVYKMLENQGINIPLSIRGGNTPPAAKTTAKPTATPAADSSSRGYINGMPTAQALSEVKSRVAGIRGVADKTPAKTPTDKAPPPTPTPYNPPKNDEELRARQEAAKQLRAFAALGGDSSAAKKQAKDAGVPEQVINRFMEREAFKASAPKNDEDMEFRREAAGNLLKAMKMKEGAAKEQALEAASNQAYAAGVPQARVERFKNEPAFAKADTLRRVRAAGREAAEAGKPERPQLNYAQLAAEAREQGFTGVKGDGGLAELYQMQADKASGVAPGTYTALSKGAKKIAPDSRIIDRYAKLVSEGRMTAAAASRKFGQDMLDKMRYDDPRLFARDEAEYQAEVAEAKRTGSPIPERPLPGADIDFEALARQVPKKKGSSARNFYSSAGFGGVYDK